MMTIRSPSFFHPLTTSARWINTANKQRPTRIKKEIPPLDVFILNNQIKTLYRRIIRTINKVPHSELKADLTKYTKDEFKINQHVKDTHDRRYLLSQGRRQFKELTTSVGLSVPDYEMEETDV